ncbi:MAG TPA: S26 family signal peptidase, partial [Rectinemataceae bacterium]|nr:S26 family signal peptidase [Rectinemataceae bacterium]
MSLFVSHRSFTEKVLASRKRRKTAGKILLVILCISLVRAFFLQSYKISSTIMEPGLVPGDLVVSFPLPLGAVTLFGKLPPIDTPKRGELVLVRPDALPVQSAWSNAWDSVIRFFTFQQVSPSALRYGERLAVPGVYRVIGLPGDTIR